jgi:hypothetical protein
VDQNTLLANTFYEKVVLWNRLMDTQGYCAEEFEISQNGLLIYAKGLCIANKVIDSKYHYCIGIYLKYRTEAYYS